jgi:hypothetical protein
MGVLSGCLPACWIAGPYCRCRLRRRAVGRARAGMAGGRSPTAPCILWVWRPVEPARSRARIAGPSPWSCGGSPASRGCTGLGVTGPSAACQSTQHHCGCILGQVGVQPEPASLGPGHARFLFEPAVALGTQRSGYYSTGQWPAHHRQAAPALGPFPDTIDSDAAGPEAGWSRDSGRRT